MDQPDLNERIITRGRAIFASMRGGAPTVFDKEWWTGKVLEAAMGNEAFKVQLFRFVDCLPMLTTGESLSRHLREYFGEAGTGLPSVLTWGTRGLALGDGLTGKIAGKAIRANVEKMARLFIAGATAGEAMKTLEKLRRAGYASTVDILGETAVSEAESLAYRRQYLDLLDRLAEERLSWKAIGGKGGLDWGHSPMISVSVKVSALYSQARPADFEGSVNGICERLQPILEKTLRTGAECTLDMEQHVLKDITLEVYRRLRAHPSFIGYPHFGVALQAYLPSTGDDLESLLAWAGTRDLPVSIRLVKGAYWDYETVVAAQKGLVVPVHTSKAATDAAFERLARRILERHDLCYLACASHNVRTIAAVLETARALGVPEDRYEFQVLYGMAEPVHKALQDVTGRVRCYTPYGELLPGIAYLVRRLLENTSNESFIRRRFAEAEEEDMLLRDPASLPEKAHPPAAAPSPPDSFRNHPLADFTRAEQREAFPPAIAGHRARDGRLLPLFIGGEEVVSGDRLASVNPADMSEVVGEVCLAAPGEIDDAVAAARKAFPAWRDTPPGERADLLHRAAGICRREIFPLAALQVLEAGKQWDQAYADVAEAVDFFTYYAREMVRLGEPLHLGCVPGEENRYHYEPRGVAAVIAPWNFPLAISAGMTGAALVTGNCVLYKPSCLTPVTGAALASIYREAGLPDGVFNFVPGRGRVIGDYLVKHPGVSLIAFTGSTEVGLGIVEKAAPVRRGQSQVKRVICEMGGKNAAIVDDDADLDLAVLEIVAAAFGYQGQKCSACSRVIVLEPIYERFVSRLTEAAESVRIGPAEDPANFLGPVIDAAAREKIEKYLEVGRSEGTARLMRDDLPPGGFYVPPAIFEGIRPEHRLAREEIFGPVIAVMKARDFDEALSMANDTPYALTGSLFSRSPGSLERAEREFRVGNLYLNRGCTGALVGRQPFGGSRLSGVGSKAGGPDYLLQFTDPRTVMENTMRRGFAPDVGESSPCGGTPGERRA